MSPRLGEWLRRRLLPAPDPEAFARQIAEGGAERTRYTELDRYRDFRAVFLGSPAGKRVLAHILAECHVWKPTYAPDDPHETAHREGERNVGLMILHRMNFEPVDRPDTANTDHPPDIHQL